MTAAYVGGMADRSLSLLTDVFLVIPTLPLLIVLTAYLAGSGSLTIIAVMIVTSWAFGGQAAAGPGPVAAHRDFLEAAKVRGERRSYIIIVEILPNMISLLVASFLGLGGLRRWASPRACSSSGSATAPSRRGARCSTTRSRTAALESGNALWMLAPGRRRRPARAPASRCLNYAFDEIGNPALRRMRRRRGKPTA